MLHRMTTLLSTVVVAFLAAPVLNAAFPTAAQAAENCLARPTDNPPEGSRWYYQTNPVTGRKCWIIDAGKAPVQNGPLQALSLQALFGLGSPNERAEPAAAVSCIKAPDGPAPRGKWWYHYTDDTTGQRCWQLGAQRSKIGNAIPARSPSIKLAAAETPAVALPRATGNANARLVDKIEPLEPVAEPLGRINPESSPGSAAEVADENPVASRWVNQWEQAQSIDRQPNPQGNSAIDRPALTVFSDVANSSKTDGELLTDDQPLYLNLFVLLASLGGALLLCGLTGGSFLYRRSAPAMQLNLPPLPDALRVAEFDDPSSPGSPDTAKPLNASGAMADSHHLAERDWQTAVDALREVGGDQTDQDSSRGQREAGGDQHLSNPFAGLGDRLAK